MQLAFQIIVGIATGALTLYAIVASARSIRRDAAGESCSCNTTPDSCAYSCKKKDVSCGARFSTHPPRRRGG